MTEKQYAKIQFLVRMYAPNEKHYFLHDKLIELVNEAAGK